jgi:hypothetical protein
MTMKKIIVAAVLMCAATASFAQLTSTVGANNAVNSNALSTNAQNINFNQPGNTDATIRSAPTVYAPAPITPFSQASCIYAASAAFSFIGFGFGGDAPIDGLTCNWRLSTQGVQATAAGLRDLAGAYKAVQPVAAVPSVEAVQLLQKSQALMNVATDMQCLNSDRQRMVMEKLGLCKEVADVATLDHRFNQPRSTQIDYSAK